jgi:hypothetical protein
MADWKSGVQVICIKDYSNIKQGDTGVIVSGGGAFINHETFEISCKDGSKKCSIKGYDIEKHFVQI